MHWQLLTVALIVAAPAPEKKDEEKLQGTWILVSSEQGGRATPDNVAKTMKMTVKGDQITINSDTTEEKMTFKLDPTKKPKTVDFLVKKGGMDDVAVPGIYELKDDELKICYVQGGLGERPTEFVTKKRTAQGLMIFKRSKNKDR
jgi:uncharacterized protein (TIGR03067 family)